MPWFRIHGKSYLLSEEERRRQIRAQREQRGPLNIRRMDDNAGPSTAPTQSLGLSTAPTQSLRPTLQPTTPTSQPFQIMPGVYPWPSSSPFSITPGQPSIYRPPSHEGSDEASLGSSSFTNLHHLIGFKHLHHR
ncbi:hypothetical protein J1N35_011789 [Gossypium stocksii]|uniref:Uncharacterized protein n=1 Tax=Gossypium stocksii TaxID=47602 RepID=A0A9D3W3D1_9ROSI|nr:hypothetical protein J1N35_011789 [Gossypium stocksii]